MTFFDPAPRYLAHRGLATDAPENTAAAIAAALEVPATHIETDIHVTADGHPVLWHDADLLRWDGTARLIRELTLSHLQEQLVDGHRIESLADMLERFPNAHFNIDVKTPTATEATADVVKQTGAQQRALLTSFNSATIDRLRKLVPDTYFGAGRGNIVQAVMAVAARSERGLRRALAGVDAVQIPPSIAGLSLISQRLLDAYHRHVQAVHVWTINDPAYMRELVELDGGGVDAVVTDRVDLARTALATSETEA